MDWLRRSCCFTMLIGLSAVLLHVPAHAQVAPSAFRATQSLWVGAEYSNIRASFPYQSGQRLSGVGVFADFKWNGRIGLSGDARFLHFGGFENSTESSYLAGPKVYFLSRGRFQPYGKFLLGEGRIHYPFQIGDASYLALAPGIGSGYRVSHHWLLRAEYEYQIWYGSPDYANEPKHQLTPDGFHLGIAYRVFR
jgi:opacity protein-like surface antigen